MKYRVKSGKAVRHLRRQRRHDEALIRQAKRDSRSKVEQLHLLDTRPGHSQKERNRLQSK